MFRFPLFFDLFRFASLVFRNAPICSDFLRFLPICFHVLKQIRESPLLTPSAKSPTYLISFFGCTITGVCSKVPEGHHPRGPTLREALRGNLPLKGLCGGLSEGSARVSLRVLRGSVGFRRGPRDSPRVFGGSDPVHVILANC